MSQQIIVSERMLNSLNAIRPWAKTLAILGFVFTILMIFAGLALTLAFTAAASKPDLALFLGPAFAIIYLVLAIFLCLIPGFLLLRYVGAIARIPADGQAALEEVLSSQAAIWKYLAIFAIVMLVLLAVVLISGGVASLV